MPSFFSIWSAGKSGRMTDGCLARQMRGGSMKTFRTSPQRAVRGAPETDAQPAGRNGGLIGLLLATTGTLWDMERRATA